MQTDTAELKPNQIVIAFGLNEATEETSAF